MLTHDAVNRRCLIGSLVIAGAMIMPIGAQAQANAATTSEAVRSRAVAPSTPGARTDLFLRPFAATSVWNLPVAKTAKFAPTSSPVMASFLGGDAVTWVNQGEYSHPVTQARLTDPVAGVQDWNDGRRSGSYRVPKTAAIAAGSDKHMHIVSPDGRTLDEAWAVERRSATRYKVGRHERVDLAGSGIGPANGTRAYGGSALGGLIRSWEVDPTHPSFTGRIDHAIAMALRSDQLRYTGGRPGYDQRGHGLERGYVWPATEQDFGSSSRYRGHVPMGAYFAIPPSVNVMKLGLSRAGLVLARAFQDYGGYVTDSSGAAVLAFVEPSAPQQFTAGLIGPRWAAADLRTIRKHLRHVTNNTASTPNGGSLGTARRKLLLQR